VAARLENDSGFAAIQRFLIVPMFLFSGTFFPVTQLPQVLQLIAYLTPLWHGVSLSRGLALGTLDGGAALGHVAYLGVWVIAGIWLARRSFRRRLAV
jgi:lipooligosaccharide transport system permease protein